MYDNSKGEILNESISSSINVDKNELLITNKPAKPMTP